MQIDPVQEWQRLTAEYREKTPDELLELARDFADLTEAAQQALRAEMRSRGLGDPEAPCIAMEVSKPGRAQPPRFIKTPSSGAFGGQLAGTLGFGSEIPELVPDDPQVEPEGDHPLDYTWKTELCDLETPEGAMQLQEALKRAGIASWIRFNGFVYPYVPSTRDAIRMGLGGLQILVAADELDQARGIAAKPIPQDIIDELKGGVPEYVAPKCPKCGAEDPTLESVEPTNHWRCENCDAEWSDGAESAYSHPTTGSDQTS